MGFDKILKIHSRFCFILCKFSCCSSVLKVRHAPQYAAGCILYALATHDSYIRLGLPNQVPCVICQLRNSVPNERCWLQMGESCRVQLCQRQLPRRLHVDKIRDTGPCKPSFRDQRLRLHESFYESITARAIVHTLG
jgi:hypothetical protein